MKKTKIIIFFIAILCLNKLFAFDFNYVPEDFHYGTSAYLTLSCPTTKLDSSKLRESVSFKIDSTTLKTNLFLCNSPDNFDILFNTIYAPKINNFNLGINTYIHSEFKYNIYTDIDFLTGLYFSNQFTNLFYFEASVMYMLKNSIIYQIKDTIPPLLSNSLAVQLDFNFTLNQKIDCGFMISSFDKYKVNPFFTPFWIFYGGYNINDSIKTGLELEFMYIDMFTLSANLNSISISANVEWLIK